PGDKQEQEQIPAGVTDRIPERVVTARHHHAGHAHERGGAEVFTGDGAGVPADGDRPAGDKKIVGGLRSFRRPEAHPDRRDYGGGAEGEDPGVEVHDGAGVRVRKRESGISRDERRASFGVAKVRDCCPSNPTCRGCGRKESVFDMYLQSAACMIQTWVSAASPSASLNLLTNTASYLRRLHASAIWAPTERDDQRPWS